MDADLLTNKAIKIAAKRIKHIKHTKSSKKTNKRRSRKRSRSFGMNWISDQASDNFKRFLIIVVIILIRTLIKKDTNNINNDIRKIEFQTLDFLTIASLLELIETLVGKTNKEKILLAYTLLSIGMDIHGVLGNVV